MWVEFYHGRRVEQVIRAIESRSHTGPEFVYGYVNKNDRVMNQIAHVTPNDGSPYYHYMDGAMYYGEIRGGYLNYAQFQPVVVQDSDGESDYVRPYWSCASCAEHDHEWFRLIYSYQVIGQTWRWCLVDTDSYKKGIRVLWYSLSDGAFRDITDLISLDFLNGVMIVHVNSIDTTYFAFRTDRFGPMSNS